MKLRAGDGRVTGNYSSTDVAKLILKATGTDNMDKKKLHKLLYYVQGWSLAALGRPAFANDLQAWKDGPVSPSMRDATINTPCFEVLPQPLETPQALNDSELGALITLVTPFYAQKKTKELIDATHEEAPWVDARTGLPEEASSQNPITDDALYSYFSKHVGILGLTPADVAMFGPESFVTEYTGEEFPDADSPLSQSANLITF